jgi:hypothetical protein
MGNANRHSREESHRCFCTQLARVKVQLIAHFLTLQERLTVARVRRRSLSDMSDGFAWKHCPPFVLRSEWSYKNMLRIPPLIHESVPVHMHVTTPISPADLKDLPAGCLTDLLMDVRKENAEWFDEAHLTATHPVLSRLKTVVVERMFNMDCFLTQITFWPALETIALFPSTMASQSFNVDDLAHCSSLTELSVQLICWKQGAWTLPFAQPLRRLHLNETVRTFSSFAASDVFAVPSTSRLEHLSLRKFKVIIHDWGECFAQLQQLRSFLLDTVMHIDDILSQLHRAPSLVRLTILANFKEECNPSGLSFRPSIPVLRELQVRKPLLRTRVALQLIDNTKPLKEMLSLPRVELLSNTIVEQLMREPWKDKD